MVLFCAGGIATPADAALMMALGAEGVFVGSGIFKSEDPPSRARAIVEATTHWQDPARVAGASRGLGAGDGEPGELQAGAGAAARLARVVSARRSERVQCETTTRPPLVGVLALQGGFEAHARMLRGLGAEVREVRAPADLEGPRRSGDPGGESTTMTLGIEREGLAEPLRELCAPPPEGRGVPVLGSCAGLIMLDRDHLGLMDMRAQRNAFGRQVRASRRTCRCGISDPPAPVSDPPARPLRGVFIRAPWIAEHGPGRGDPRGGGRPPRWRPARATGWRSPSTPSSRPTSGVHRLFLGPSGPGGARELTPYLQGLDHRAGDIVTFACTGRSSVV